MFTKTYPFLRILIRFSSKENKGNDLVIRGKYKVTVDFIKHFFNIKKKCVEFFYDIIRILDFILQDFLK